MGDALDRGLQGTSLAGQYEYRLRAETASTFGGPLTTHYAKFAIKSGVCLEAGVRCTVRVGVAHVQPEISSPPAALGLGPGYAFGPNASAGIAFNVLDTRPLQHRRLARYPFLEALTAASARLPPWIFIYIAAGNISYFDAQRREHVFLPFPIVLRQGEILPFVQGYRAPVPARS